MGLDMASQLSLQLSSAADYIALVDYKAQTALKAQFLKFNNLDQARQLAEVSVSTGVPMLDICLTFDIISGRLSKKAAAMLAEFKARGGKYKVVSKTADLASIEYTYDGQTQVFSLSWEEIKNESYTKEKDGKTYKANYATPHARKKMLWARVVSDSIRTVAPECTGGYYTPEETQDIIDGECTTIPMTAGALPAPGSTTAERPSRAALQATQSAATSQVDEMISSEHQIELQSLFATLALSPETIAQSLAKRGVSQVDQLTAVQATEIIAALRSRLPSTDGQQSIQMTGPITQELQARIETEIKACAQVTGGTAAIESVHAHLAKHGLLLHQLTLAEGEHLLNALQQRNLRIFLDLALNGAQGKA